MLIIFYYKSIYDFPHFADAVLYGRGFHVGCCTYWVVVARHGCGPGALMSVVSLSRASTPESPCSEAWGRRLGRPVATMGTVPCHCHLLWGMT